MPVLVLSKLERETSIMTLET